ncbi:hypothetical protein ACFL2T_01850 [Elusimicrobiota bacterium]
MRGIALFLAVAVLAVASPAMSWGEGEYVREEFKVTRWPAMTCSVPALPGVPAEVAPTLISGEATSTHLLSVGRDIIDFHEARTRAYSVYAEMMTLTHAYCPHESFDGWMDAHNRAFENWKNGEINHYSSGAVKWVSKKRFEKLAKGVDEAERNDPFGLRSACRAVGGEPPSLKVPIQVHEAPLHARGPLMALARDTVRFLRLQKDLNSAHLAMLSLEGAFNCREVLIAYEVAKVDQYRAFLDRRNEDLANIAKESLDWGWPD